MPSVEYTKYEPLNNDSINSSTDSNDSNDSKEFYGDDIEDRDSKVYWYNISSHVGLPVGHTEYNKFISKVLGVILFQLVLTFIETGIIYCIPLAADAFREYWWIQLIGGVSAIVFLVLLMIFRHVKIINWIFLILFTSSISVMFAALAVYFSAYQILEACAITSIIFCTLVIVVLVMKVDCSNCGFIIFSVAIAILWWALFAFLFTPMWYHYTYTSGDGTVYVYNYWFQLLILPYIFIYVGCLMIDLSTLKDMNYDEYLIAAVQIYIDIINLIMYLLIALTGKD